MVKEYAHLVIQQRQYFKIHYSLLNQLNLWETILLVMTMVFMWSGNWYCGIIAILHAWTSIPFYLFRLHKGGSIIIFQKVFKSALEICHILLFFMCGFGCVIVLGLGNKSSLSKALQAMMLTL